MATVSPPADDFESEIDAEAAALREQLTPQERADARLEQVQARPVGGQ